VKIQELLENSFLRNADRIAISHEDINVGYSELNNSAELISTFIIESGYTKGSLIGVLTTRKDFAISVIIGILKAGCVFVPLDCNWPFERIKQLIKFIDLSLIITENSSNIQAKIKLEDFISLVKVKEFDIDNSTKNGLINSGGGNSIEYSEDDPIYVYFTSGTSGNPKAILGKNKSLSHFIEWEIKELNINKDYHVSQISAIGFDAFLRDVFLALVVGGTIVIPKSKETFLDNHTFINWIERKGINIMHCVPSIFRIISSSNLRPNYFRSLKVILMAGEEINPEGLSFWYSNFKNRIQLINMYGATEATMAQTFYFITELDINKNKIPAGKAISGSQVLVLDEFMRPSPKLVEGDIYIRTPFLTFGYCNSIDITSNAFIKNPFSDNPDDFLYRTGDKGRLLKDNNLEFLGRNSEIVKIRGNRVNPGEIENCLLKFHGINDVVVMPKVDSENNNYLVAYIIPVGPFNSQKYRDYLIDKLPEYMVPNIWMGLESFPLTINGKIDMGSFPEPAFKKTEKYISPRNEQEELIKNLWLEFLDVKPDQLSINDNYFLLGGNSLKLVSLISKLQRLTGIKVPIGYFFNNPTIENIAAYLAENQKGDCLDVKKVEKKEYYPLSSVQKRIYFLQNFDIGSTAYNMSGFFQLGENITKSDVEKIFRKIIDRHESLRTSFHLIDGEPVQKIEDKVNFSVDNLNLLRKDFINQEFTNFIKPFNLSNSPLIRCVFVEINEDYPVLFIDIHHIISDGVSQNIIMNEVHRILEKQILTEVKLQFKDFAEWEYSKEYSRIIESQEKYWLELFNKIVPVYSMPGSNLRKDQSLMVGAKASFNLSYDVTTALKQISNDLGITQYILLLGVFKIFISKLSGQTDIVIGTPIAGRNNIGFENTIGMFVNTLPIRSSLNPELTIKEYLLALKSIIIKVFENQNYPFDKLIDKLNIKREVSRNPLFDVMFVLQNQIEIISGSEIDIRNHNEKHDHTLVHVKFDFTCNCIDYKNYYKIIFMYNNQLYPDAVIDEYISIFKSLVKIIIQNTDKSLADISLINQLNTSDFKDVEVEFDF